MNRICLVGRMGKDADFKYLNDGTAVANFSLAVNRPFKDKASGKYESDWFSISSFGKTAEFVSNHCGKGRLVSVEGRMQCRKYQDQGGNTRDAWEVRADTVQGVGPSPENAEKPHTSTDGGDHFDDPFAE